MYPYFECPPDSRQGRAVPNDCVIYRAYAMSDKKDEGTTPQDTLRTQAEAKLAAAGKAKPTPSLGFDELLQEPCIHQVELEIQNEELRRTQAELEKTMAHYVDLYDFAPVGYLTLNDEGIILEINLTASRLLGENRANVIGRRFTKFIADEHKDLWYRHFQLAKQADGKYGCELPFVDAQGNTLHYHLDCLFNHDLEYRPNVRITLTDVTMRKLAETELRIAAVAFETQDCIVVADANKKKLRVNKAFSRITGYSAEESNNLSFFNSKLHDTDMHQELWAAIARDGHWRGEIWDERKNGEPFLMAISITAVKDDQGELNHYVADFIDITERKRNEEALRIAAAAFKAQESIMVTDNKRVILRVNDAFTRISGYSAEEAIGNTPRILRSGFHDKAFYDEVLETVAKDGYWEGEIWNKRKNGDIFPALQTITAVRDEAGQLTHYVGAMMDISAQKQAEKFLLDARKRLENEVVTTQEELEAIKVETAEINTALNFLLKYRDKDKVQAQLSLSNEVETIVLPLLAKLKGASKNRTQSLRMIAMIEGNLQDLMRSYGSTGHIDAAFQKLTPLEKQVAAMVKLGQPTKVIAATLNIADGTVNIHRKHIRKKLGLDNKENLQAYLQSLSNSN
jgi:PAS domain S-box-containing protein